MTLVQLRHFVALAEAGSFVKAAAQVFLTQPALTRSIQALEAHWGAPLFDRVGRRVELTPNGRELLPRVRALLEDARELADGPARLQRQVALGTLRIGMGSGAGALLMTPLLQAAAQRHPGFRVEVARGRTELLVQSLRDRRLDALVVDARSLRPEADLRADFLHEMPGAFLVRPGHPLLQRLRRSAGGSQKSGLRFEAVAQYPIASTPLSDEVARLLVERYGPAAEPGTCVSLQCEEISSLVEVATTSDAVLLAARGAAPKLVELPLDPPLAATARFGLVTLARRTEHAALGLVRAMLAMVVAQIVAGAAVGGSAEAVAITLAWSAAWLASAWLFRRAC